MTGPSPNLSSRVEPFGKRAVSLGLVTLEQVEKALAVQRMLDKSGQHQLLGMILVDLEMLTTTQLLAILQSYGADGYRGDL